MTPEDNKVLDDFNEFLIDLKADMPDTIREPVSEEYDFVLTVQWKKHPDQTKKVSILEMRASPKYAAELVRKSEARVEDIYYEYKDDGDCDFDFYMATADDAKKLYDYLKNHGHTLTQLRLEDSDKGTFVVTVEFRTVEEKESFVLALREQNYNPNGG